MTLFPAKDGHISLLTHTKGSKTMKTKQSNKKRIKEIQATRQWERVVQRNYYRECYYRLIRETRHRIMRERHDVVFHHKSDVRKIALKTLLDTIRFQRLMLKRLRESRAIDPTDSRNVSPLP